MRTKSVLCIVAAWTQLTAVHAIAATVTVSSTESWNGTLNPHAADGVTLAAGSGTEADPSVYTIPNGMNITATGKITTTADKSIKFLIQGGNLSMEAGGKIDISVADRGKNSSTVRRVFFLDMSGTNSITGAGTITSGVTNGQAAVNQVHRALMITNVNNVAFSNLSLIVNNAATTYPQFERSAFITASNSVTITGLIENKDIDTGGNGAADVTITASAISVKDMDTRGMRTAGTINGNIALRALQSPGYSTNSVANKLVNKLTAGGTIRTAGAGTGSQGNLTMHGVVVQLDSGFSLALRSGATTNVNVGATINGAAEGELFINNSAVSLSPVRNVLWSAAGSPGVISLSATTYATSESDTFATITVKRAGGSVGAASVQFTTGNGTATSGSDFTATNGVLNWADGDLTDRTFSVPVSNDSDVELDESVMITLGSATGATLGSPSSATLTIADNDGVPVSYSSVGALDTRSFSEKYSVEGLLDSRNVRGTYIRFY